MSGRSDDQGRGMTQFMWLQSCQCHVRVQASTLNYQARDKVRQRAVSRCPAPRGALQVGCC